MSQKYRDSSSSRDKPRDKSHGKPDREQYKGRKDGNRDRKPRSDGYIGSERNKNRSEGDRKPRSEGYKGDRNKNRGDSRSDRDRKPRIDGFSAGTSRNDRAGRKESLKRRDLHGNNYYIYGKHAVEAALKNKERKIHFMMMTPSTMEAMPILAEYKHIPYRVVTTDELNIILKDESVHQGVAIEASPLPEKALEDIEFPEGKAVVVILDQVSDPHNVGAILRSAQAFGASALIVPEHHAARESGVMAKASSGALERVPLVTVTNLAACMKTLKTKDFWLVGLDGGAETTIGNMPDYQRIAFVMGAEGAGLRRLTTENCDILVKIPIGNGVESLNVSNAAAVALYAARMMKA